MTIASVPRRGLALALSLASVAGVALVRCVSPAPAPGQPVPSLDIAVQLTDGDTHATVVVRATDFEPTSVEVGVDAAIPPAPATSTPDGFEIDLDLSKLPAGPHMVVAHATDAQQHVFETADITLSGCNGWPALCSRRYDAVAYATTHNAMSNSDAGWILPNQHHGIARQLEDGVRGLMLDTHYGDDGSTQLCHSYCELGSEPLVDGLGEIKGFLDDHPGAVVTIIFESYISHADTAKAFADVGLDSQLYAHSRGEPWPTLEALIDAGTRLVVFQDKALDPAYPWLMNIWDEAWETPYSFKKPDDFTCDPNRGTVGQPLFILNHFLTNIGGSPDSAEMVNHDPLLLDRARQCEARYTHIPNFVTVDFYDIGDLFEAVDALNGFGAPAMSE